MLLLHGCTWISLALLILLSSFYLTQAIPPYNVHNLGQSASLGEDLLRIRAQPQLPAKLPVRASSDTLNPKPSQKDAGGLSNEKGASGSSPKQSSLSEAAKSGQTKAPRQVKAAGGDGDKCDGPDDGSDEDPPADEIPSGEGKDAVQHTGMDPNEFDYKSASDYDPDQDIVEGNNSPGTNQDKDKSPAPPSKGSTPPSTSDYEVLTGPKKTLKSRSFGPYPENHLDDDNTEYPLKEVDMNYHPNDDVIEYHLNDSETEYHPMEPGYELTRQATGRDYIPGRLAERAQTSAKSLDPGSDSKPATGLNKTSSSLGRQEAGKAETGEGPLAANAKAFKTIVLRSVSVCVNKRLKNVRDAFLATASHKYIGLKGPENYAKDKAVEIFESKDELKPGKPGEKKWQADHVNDLGYWTQIAREGRPKGVSEKAWKVVEEAIGGDKDGKKTDNTKVIGKILNNPTNIRGISFEFNEIKNAITQQAYDGTKPKDLKRFTRSATWGTFRYILHTKGTFDYKRKAVAKKLASFEDIDKDSAKIIETTFNDRQKKIFGDVLDIFKSFLKDPPPQDDKDSMFLVEDCNNTVDTPDKQPDSQQTGTTAPTPSTPSVTPVNPPSAPSCYPAPSGDYQDSHEGAVKEAAKLFCKTKAEGIMAGGLIDDNLTDHLYALGNDSKDDDYEIFIKSVNGCKAPPANLDEPIPGHKCADILGTAWKNCYNKGRGGAITAGCFLYSIHPKY